MDFDWKCLLGKFQPSQLVWYWASSSRLSSFVHHVVRDVKFDAQGKRFLLTTFSRFIGLCRVSVMLCIELLDKKLTVPGPEISVHPGVTLILPFFVTFFLTENREAACFTGDYSALTNRFSSIMYLINNIIRKYNSFFVCIVSPLCCL